MEMTRLFPVILALCLASSVARCARECSLKQGSPKSDSLPTVNQRTRYCKSVEEFTQATPPHRFFAETASSPDATARWHEFSSQKDLEASDFHSAAFVWFRNGKLVASNFTLQSDSRDWALYGNFCYDERGMVAEIKEELRTLYGNIAVKRSYVYDTNGKLVKRTERFTEIGNETPKKPDQEFIDEKLPIYLRVIDLPFISLMRSHR